MKNSNTSADTTESFFTLELETPKKSFVYEAGKLICRLGLKQCRLIIARAHATSCRLLQFAKSFVILKLVFDSLRKVEIGDENYYVTLLMKVKRVFFAT